MLTINSLTPMLLCHKPSELIQKLVSNVVEIALQDIDRSGRFGCLLTWWEVNQHPVFETRSIHQ